VIRTTRLFSPGVPPTSSPYPTSYAVNRDGTRFMVKTPVLRPEALPIRIDVNALP
jgi:hypothetical protein